MCILGITRVTKVEYDWVFLQTLWAFIGVWETGKTSMSSISWSENLENNNQDYCKNYMQLCLNYWYFLPLLTVCNMTIKVKLALTLRLTDKFLGQRAIPNRNMTKYLFLVLGINYLWSDFWQYFWILRVLQLRNVFF